MKDFLVNLCAFLLVIITFYAYVQIICDGVWVCAFDSSPRTCATVNRIGGVK